MKNLFAVAVFISLAFTGEAAGVSTQCSGVPETTQSVLEQQGQPNPTAAVEPIGETRITCDLLSFNLPWGSFGNSLCAAHCLAKGRRGGWCEKGVCHCR